mmetsp:Transcript_15332/g.33660  ORF Transcript_15332/g.33660 Transcript_15332/m.33660 type:complete len:805 (-) Transcript_15332:84-2498(-)
MLILPQSVRINNIRLECTYYVILAAFVILFIVKFVLAKDYVRAELISTAIHPTLWVSRSNSSEEFQQALLAARSWCKEARDLDYSYDVREYLNHSCVGVCDGFNRNRCITPQELSVREGIDQYFFVTQTLEQRVDGTGIPIGDANAFVYPGVEALGVEMRYRYDVPLYDFWGTETGTDTQVSSENILTVLLDSNGQTVRTISPAPSITLSISEILALAGNRQMLDEAQNSLGLNTLFGATPQGPKGRVAGLHIALLLRCYSYDQYNTGYDGPVCSIAFQQQGQLWAERTEHDRYTDTGDALYRVKHGIRLFVDTAGIYEHWDVRNTFHNFIGAVVVLHLPTVCVLFIANNLLGRLSRIYYSVTRRPFDLTEQVTGMALRIGSSCMLYSTLKDHSGGISRVRLGALLRQALSARSEVLDTEEVERFVNYCFSAYFKETLEEERRQKHAEQQDRVGRNHGEDSRVLSMDAQMQLDIDVDKYIVGCSSADPMTLHDVVSLFDKDRLRNPLEIFFTPQEVSVAVYAKNIVHPRLREAVKEDMVYLEKERSRSGMSVANLQVPPIVSPENSKKTHRVHWRDGASPRPQGEQNLVTPLQSVSLAEKLDKLLERVMALEKRLEEPANSKAAVNAAPTGATGSAAPPTDSVAVVVAPEGDGPKPEAPEERPAIAESPQSGSLEKRVAEIEEATQAMTLRDWQHAAALETLSKLAEQLRERLSSTEEKLRNQDAAIDKAIKKRLEKIDLAPGADASTVKQSLEHSNLSTRLSALEGHGLHDRMQRLEGALATIRMSSSRPEAHHSRHNREGFA